MVTEGREGWRMVALVTAGDSAIGRHLVLALAGAGHDVALTHVGAADAAALVCDQVAALGRRARAWECDAGDEAAVAAFHAQAADWAGAAPDVLVNNAGSRPGPASSTCGSISGMR